MFENVSATSQKLRSVSFSGHRLIVPANQHSLFGWNIDKPEYHWNYMTGATGAYVESVRKKLDSTLKKLVSEGYDTFFCGMATGFDLMAGTAVCDLIDAGAALSLIAAIPFPEQPDRYPPEERSAYGRIMDYSSASHIVCGSYRRECFHLRNDFLIDNSSVLVCFYNGSPGGTQYTVKKALKNKLRIINLV